MTTLGEAVARFEGSFFVGRDRPVAWFVDWLETEDPDVAILNVVGHGGVGKTALLGRFAAECHARGQRARVLDGHSIAADLPGLLAALGHGDLESAVAALDDARPVLLIDSFHDAPALFRPLFDELLPRLATPVRVVVASRAELLPRAEGHPLSRAALRLDLRPFTREEVRRYLHCRGVHDEDATRQILHAGGGNPLATSTAADLVLRSGPGALRAAGDWREATQGLTERLLRDLDPPLRDLVEAAAVVRQFDEDLLRALTDQPVSADLLGRMARLAMVRPAERGMRLHDDVREIVAAGLRARGAERVGRLRARALAHYRERMDTAGPREREFLVNERLWLWEHDFVRTALFPAATGERELLVEPHGPTDRDDILSLWRSHAGVPTALQGGAPSDDLDIEEVAALLEHQDARFMMVRDRDGVLLAVGVELLLAADSREVIPAVLRPVADAVAGGDDPLPPTAAAGTVRYLGPIAARPDADAATGLLARWAIGSWIHGGTIVVATTMPGYAGVMESLGFARLPVDAEVRGRRVHGLVLDLDEGDVEEWMRRITSMVPSPPPSGAAETVAVTLLGGFSVRRGGEEVTPSGRAAQAVKHVAVAGGALHVEELADRLWPEAARQAGRARLRNVLARVRDVAGEVLVRDGDILRLADDVEVDADNVADAVRRATAVVRHDPDHARQLAEEAIDAYGGPLLPGDLYVEAFSGHRERLRRLRVTALDTLAAAAAAGGDVTGAVAALERAIEADPYDEDRYRRAATLLRDGGRPAAALAMVRRAHRMNEELGVSASPALRALASELRG